MNTMPSVQGRKDFVSSLRGVLSAYVALSSNRIPVCFHKQ